MNRNNYPFTQDEMKAAYETSVIDLAQQYGYELKAERDVYHIKGFGGLYIWQNGLGWYQHSTQDRGNNVDFLMKFCGVDRKIDAIRMLLTTARITPAAELRINNEPPKPKGKIKLPEKFSGTYGNLYWYLMTKRCIDKDVVYKCLYDRNIYQDIHRNVVFCGKDNSGNIKYASVRGTVEIEGKEPFKGEVFNSDKKYGFRIDGTSDRLFVFEAPIDAMSHATLCKLSGLDWQMDTRLALGGTSDLALKQYLSDNPQIKQIVFCLDNDFYKWDKNLRCWNNVGQNVILKYVEKYKEKYIIGRSRPPIPFKDFNEYLTGSLHPEFAQQCKVKACQCFIQHDSPEKIEEYFPEEQAEIQSEPIPAPEA